MNLTPVNIAITVTLACVVLLCTVILWFSLLPEARRNGPELYAETPFQVLSKNPAPGQDVVIESEWCNETDKAALVPFTASWVRGEAIENEVLEIVPGGSGTVTFEPGCHTFRVVVALPLDLEDGEWRRTGFVTYEEEQVAFFSEGFRVVGE